jgi:hypothetical protein
MEEGSTTRDCLSNRPRHPRRRSTAFFTNNGTLDVQGGTLSLGGIFTSYNSGTLFGGTYLLAGNLQFIPFSGLATNAANIVIDGPSGGLIDFGNNNLVTGLTLNQSTGKLTLKNGANVALSAPFTNAGTVTIDSTSSLNVSGNYVQTGGSTTLGGGTLTASSEVDVNGGSLSGPGTINANVVNAGQINPGGTSKTTGLLTINGNYTQTATGVLHVGLAGTTAFDQLAVTGTATLDGMLAVALLNHFQPQDGDLFAVLTYGSVNGTFKKYHFPPLSGGLLFNPVFNSSDLTLQVQT